MCVADDRADGKFLIQGYQRHPGIKKHADIVNRLSNRRCQQVDADNKYGIPWLEFLEFGFEIIGSKLPNKYTSHVTETALLANHFQISADADRADMTKAIFHMALACHGIHHPFDMAARMSSLASTFVQLSQSAPSTDD